MPAIRIQELAEVMIQELAPLYGKNPDDIKIDTIGAKPGEKMYEELLNLEEIRRTIELQRYFVTLPAFSGLYKNIDYSYKNIISKTVTNPYHSAIEKPLSKPDLATFLKTNSLLLPGNGNE